MSTKTQEQDKTESQQHNEDHGHVHGPHCNHGHHHHFVAPVVRTAPKVGRNVDCPCGSQKKYKKCCGK